MENPEIDLKKILERCPDLNKLINHYRNGRGKKFPTWPQWCFMPLAAWIGIASIYLNDPYGTRLETIFLAQKLAAYGTWMYSKGIYRFDADLLDALINSPLSGDIPTSVLYRLPEFCLYFDVSARKESFDGSSGVYVFLEWDANTKQSELRIQAGEMALPVHMGNWSVEEGIQQTLNVSRKNAKGRYLPELPTPAQQKMIDIASAALSLALYICSDEPEIDTDHTPGWSPYRAAPVRTKEGPRLFPSDKTHIHQVGTQIGERLRAAREEKTAEPGEKTDWQGGTVRAHLRRGHWHGFWRGKRGTSNQKFIYHWIHPLIAGGKRDIS